MINDISRLANQRPRLGPKSSSMPHMAIKDMIIDGVDVAMNTESSSSCSSLEAGSTWAASDASPESEPANIQVTLVHETYVDCSRIPDDASQESVDVAIECARKGFDPTTDDAEGVVQKSTCSKATFPKALFDIVADPTLDDIICWLPHGRAWHIVDMEKFNNQVLSSYFNQSKFTSFVRQVNGWGFRRVQKPNGSTYYHEMFLRGRDGLLKFMRRQPASSVNGAGGNRNLKDDESHPNFYSIAESFPLPPNAPRKAKQVNTKEEASANRRKKSEAKRKKRRSPPSKNLHTKARRRQTFPPRKVSVAESSMSESMYVESQVPTESNLGDMANMFTPEESYEKHPHDIQLGPSLEETINATLTDTYYDSWGKVDALDEFLCDIQMNEAGANVMASNNVPTPSNIQNQKEESKYHRLIESAPATNTNSSIARVSKSLHPMHRHVAKPEQGSLYLHHYQHTTQLDSARRRSSAPNTSALVSNETDTADKDRMGQEVLSQGHQIISPEQMLPVLQCLFD